MATEFLSVPASERREAPSLPAGRGTRRRLSSVAPVVALHGVLGVLILVPAAFVLLAAFSVDVPRPGNVRIDLTLQNFAVLGEPGVVQAVVNSLVIGVLATAGAILLGGTLAFLAARTDVPLRRFVFLAGMMPLFFPSYVGALAWSMLASPVAGMLNVALGDLGLGVRMDAYSIGGVAAVLALYYAPYPFLFIHSSMSLMNPELEAAAHVHGGSSWQALKNVTLPLSLPAILGSGVLVFILVFENFPVAQVLASPDRIDTIPTFIFRLMNASPSRGNEGAAIAVVLVAVVLLVTWLQRRTLARRSYATISGKGVKPRRITLGRLRWLAFAFAGVYFLLTIVLPAAALLLTSIRTSSFMPSYSVLGEPGALSLDAFREVLRSELFLTATRNSLVVSLLAAALGTALAFVVVYTAYRTRHPGRGSLELVSMVPLAIPAIVLGMGLLWTWLVMPVPLYGTLWLMVVAFLAVQMPQGFRGIAASILQTDRGLEDSAVVSGARRTRAIAYVTLPLIRTGLVSTFLLLLMLSMRELTVPLFLYTSNTRILSIAIFDLFENGGALQHAAAMSLVYCVMMFVLTYLPRRIGSTDGLV